MNILVPHLSVKLSFVYYASYYADSPKSHTFTELKSEGFYKSTFSIKQKHG